MRNLSNKKVSLIAILVPALLINALAFVIFCADTSAPGNNPPIVISLTPSKRQVNFQESITVRADVKDADGDSISYLWISDKGNFVFTSLDSAIWNAPDTSGRVSIILRVNDDFEGRDEDSTIIIVQNQGPIINSLTASKTNIMVGNIITLRVHAEDPDGGVLLYNWTANGGEFTSDITADSVLWRASTSVEDVTIRVKVTDNIGDFAQKDIMLKVFQETGSVWIADTFNDEIVKLASNGTQLLRIGGFLRPSKIALDLNDRSVWVADKGNNRLVKFSELGEQLFTITGLDRPTNLAVQSNGNIWVTTMRDSGQVIEYAYNGAKLRQLYGFKEPQSVDVNALNGDIWIADTGNNRIVLLDANVPDDYDISDTGGATDAYDTKFSGYTNPGGLVVDQATGNCWIADTGNHRVVRISSTDQTEFVISGFLNPRGVDVNIKDGSCWVANTGDNEMIRISQDIFRLPANSPWAYNIDQDAGFHTTVSGYLLPWSVSINSNDNVVWFTDDFHVVKIKDEGQYYSLIAELVNFNAPRSITVNPGIKP